MPELPEVETMVRGVRPALLGRTILDVEFCKCERKPITISPSTRVFRKTQQGRRVTDVRRLAKRIVIELEDEFYVLIEPRMTGLMLVADPPTQEHRRLCWHLQRKRGQPDSVEFWDRRGLGTASLVDAAGLQDVSAKLGPDALTMSAADWKQRLSRTSREIKVALLEQKLVAGIGNLYAAEILHRARISPKRRASKITKPQCERLAAATQHILNQAIKYEGSTLGDGTYRNVLNQDGSYQNEHQVYGREGECCSACDQGTIKRIVQAQRSTFYCPKCQRG